MAYGDQWKEKGKKVTPLPSNRAVADALKIKETASKNKAAFTSKGGRRISGVSGRDTSGIAGSYTGAGVGAFVSSSAKKYGKEITKAVQSAAQPFPAFKNAYSSIYTKHMDKSTRLESKMTQAGNLVDRTRYRGNIDNSIQARDAYRKAIKKYKGQINYGQYGFEGFEGAAKLQAKKMAGAITGRSVAQGVGKALGYAGGVGLAVDIALGAKWAYDYNVKNQGTYGQQQAKNYKKITKNI